MVTYLHTQFQPCIDRQGCAQKVKDYARHLQRVLPEGKRLLRELLSSPSHSITADDEAVEQIFQAIHLSTPDRLYRTVAQLVKSSESEMIEWNTDVQSVRDLIVPYGSRIFILKGEIGERNRHPLHVVCGMNHRPNHRQHWGLQILAAYNPSTPIYQLKWSTDYQTRLCFCEEEPKDIRSAITDERVHLHLPNRIVYSTYDKRP